MDKTILLQWKYKLVYWNKYEMALYLVICLEVACKFQLYKDGGIFYMMQF